MSEPKFSGQVVPVGDKPGKPIRNQLSHLLLDGAYDKPGSSRYRVRLTCLPLLAEKTQAYWLFCRLRKRGMSSGSRVVRAGASSSTCALAAPRAMFDMRSKRVPPSRLGAAGASSA